MQRYAITGKAIPLSENGVPQIGFDGAVNIPEKPHDVYMAEDVSTLLLKLHRAAVHCEKHSYHGHACPDCLLNAQRERDEALSRLNSANERVRELLDLGQQASERADDMERERDAALRRLGSALEIMRLVEVDYARGLDEDAGLDLVERIKQWMGAVEIHGKNPDG